MTNWDEDELVCPHCKDEDLVLPTHIRNSTVLLIGEFPGDEEIKHGRPFVGATGSVLKTELARVGLDIRQFSLANLWIHKPNSNKACLEYGITKIIQIAKGKTAILLIGSDVVGYFVDEKVSQVNGLEVKSPYLSAPLIMACIQPATVFHQPLGELRLTLSKFAKKLKEITK